MAADTAYTLDQFLADTRATIKTKGVPSGLAEIRDHLEKSATIPRPTCTCWSTDAKRAASLFPTTTVRAG